MKILLVGEYSRLHNSLKEGLVKLGHEVTIVGSGDEFKKYPVDIQIKSKFEKGWRKKFMVLCYKLFGINLKANSIKNQFFEHAEKLRGYDVVQLINESPLGANPEVEMECIDFLKSNNKQLFLLSCGTDHLSVKYALEKKFRYSILTPLFEGRVSEADFDPVLKYVRPEYKALHDFVFERIEGVIASDLDYHIPLIGHEKYLGMIPNPINTKKIEYIPLEPTDKIVIFHGINRPNYFKKGSDYFSKALKRLKISHGDRIEIITAESVPYAEYIKLYDRAHILLDQVLGYDQGYNALEAMAKGKVVFTGAEKEHTDYFGLTENVAVNASPDVDQIYESLVDLIESPVRIQQISRSAREFIEKEHDYLKIAQKYLDIYTA
ncbi:glycosyltransferase [Aureitalea sp. L0-47]|uniref:glycosyltransferase n=1 Tax=Aureitalea sp. L0-47 TaxID=2816962 RepID=UPI002237D2F6|nr:glycosyltransferase [Aureitalea sp. L0-47]MCW5520695.1 glycosyltransferase [Aureitalea sp. L0-47]